MRSSRMCWLAFAVVLSTSAALAAEAPKGSLVIIGGALRFGRRRSLGKDRPAGRRHRGQDRRISHRQRQPATGRRPHDGRPACGRRRPVRRARRTATDRRRLPSGRQRSRAERKSPRGSRRVLHRRRAGADHAGAVHRGRPEHAGPQRHLGRLPQRGRRCRLQRRRGRDEPRHVSRCPQRPRHAHPGRDDGQGNRPAGWAFSMRIGSSSSIR